MTKLPTPHLGPKGRDRSAGEFGRGCSARLEPGGGEVWYIISYYIYIYIYNVTTMLCDVRLYDVIV